MFLAQDQRGERVLHHHKGEAVPPTPSKLERQATLAPGTETVADAAALQYRPENGRRHAGLPPVLAGRCQF